MPYIVRSSGLFLQSAWGGISKCLRIWLSTGWLLLLLRRPMGTVRLFVCHVATASQKQNRVPVIAAIREKVQDSDLSKKTLEETSVGAEAAAARVADTAAVHPRYVTLHVHAEIPSLSTPSIMPLHTCQQLVLRLPTRTAFHKIRRLLASRTARTFQTCLTNTIKMPAINVRDTMRGRYAYTD